MTSTTIPSTTATVGDLFDHLGPQAPVVLAVFAHPDDESFVAAGFLLEAARRGGRVVTLTATAGEHGTPDPTRDPPAALAARRHAELGSALRVLGADAPRLFGFADGSCDLVPDAIGARMVGAVVDEIRPDAVVGFGPDGVTGHPDHIATARWVAQALARRGAATPHFTTAAGAAWPESGVAALSRIGAFWPGYPERVVPDPVVRFDLDGVVLEHKLAALRCHESQIGPVETALGPDGLRRLAAREAYQPANAAAAALVGGLMAAA